MKRFWTEATCTPEGEGWAVLLDGKPVRVPGGAALLLPTRGVAEAVAAEWQAAGRQKGGEMSYADLPLTRLAGTAQERIAPDPEPVTVELSQYGQSDLLCYRASHPPALAALQAERWQPWLDWAAETHGAPLRITQGIIHVPQDAEALAALAGTLCARSPYALAALGVAVPVLGSLVLGLAVADGVLDAAEAYALSQVDETFQTQLWGRDAEAEIKRRRDAADVAHAARLLALLRAAA
jgi:chaperone required for assembly of F1-ATPase